MNVLTSFGSVSDMTRGVLNIVKNTSDPSPLPAHNPPRYCFDSVTQQCQLLITNGQRSVPVLAFTTDPGCDDDTKACQ